MNDGVAELPRTGEQVSQVVADGQVLGIGLKDGLVLDDGLIPLTLLREGEGILQGFSLVEGHRATILFCVSRWLPRTLAERPGGVKNVRVPATA